MFDVSCCIMQKRRRSSESTRSQRRNCAMSNESTIEVIPLSALPEPDRSSSGSWQLSCVLCSSPSRQPQAPRRVHSSTSKRRRRRVPRYNSVSKIDRASRIVFPLLFLAINVFYWFAYLSRSERIYG